MTSPDVIVVGAGVLGLCAAAELAARGRRVTVVDPGGPNASSIAAGMIAPALESVLEGASAERAALLRRARDLWPGFAERHGIALHREGAEWRGPETSVEALRALGFAAEPRETGVFTPDDWRIEPEGALTALAMERGVTLIEDCVETVEDAGGKWRMTLAAKRGIAAPDLVIATGAAAPLPGLPENVRALIAAVTPIRGQLVRLAVEAPPQVIRAGDIYAVPAPGGVLAGATMEAGRRDLEPDQAEAGRQARAAGRLLSVEPGQTAVRVGIRGATSDGLPMAGPAGTAGLHLALAPRRNGWLLGPLVGAVVTDGVEGGAPSVDAAALDPLRFNPER